MTTLGRDEAVRMVLGLAPSTLHLQLNGLRPMPAEVAAAIRRALPEIQDRE